LSVFFLRTSEIFIQLKIKIMKEETGKIKPGLPERFALTVTQANLAYFPK
jgi:hypothetical protein